MYAPRGAGQNVAPSFIFKTSLIFICVNEVKYLKQVLYVCYELYKCMLSVNVCVYLFILFLFYFIYFFTCLTINLIC